MKITFSELYDIIHEMYEPDRINDIKEIVLPSKINVLLETQMPNETIHLRRLKLNAVKSDQNWFNRTRQPLQWEIEL